MAKVFTGKVVIPGDKIDEYFASLIEAEKERKPFREMFKSLIDEFYDELQNRFTEATARKHTHIISMFLEFICNYTDVEKLEDITKGMVNTHFNNWYRRKVMHSVGDKERRATLKKFFKFLDEQKGITNETVLKALK